VQHVVIGPVDDDLVQEFFLDAGEDMKNVTRSTASSMEELLVVAGIFTSKGQARKAGFTGTIPPGIHLLGTKKNRFWCWTHPQSTTEIAARCDHRCFCPWKNADSV
jgi:hypothetical protein